MLYKITYYKFFFIEVEIIFFRGCIYILCSTFLFPLACMFRLRVYVNSSYLLFCINQPTKIYFIIKYSRFLVEPLCICFENLRIGLSKVLSWYIKHTIVLNGNENIYTWYIYMSYDNLTILPNFVMKIKNYNGLYCT